MFSPLRGAREAAELDGLRPVINCANLFCMLGGEHGEMLRAVCVAAAGLWASPEAPRERDAAVLQNPARLRDWLDEQEPLVRRELRGRFESQILLGDTVWVDAVVDGWAKVVAPSQPSDKNARGYPGWIPVAQLAPPALETGLRVVVTVPVTDLLSDPDGEILIQDVGFGTILPEAGRVSGWVRVNLPADGQGWLPEYTVAAYRDGGPLPTGDEFVAAARQFVGAGFLPGGIHGLGFDCSGLMHVLYRRFGYAFPRNARDAIKERQTIEAADLQHGDIVYFMRPDAVEPGHCAILTGPQSVLHTSHSAGGCVDGVPIRPGFRLSGVRYLPSGE